MQPLVTLGEALKDTQTQLAHHHILSSQTESEQLLEALLGISRLELWTRRSQTLSRDELTTLQAWISRRCAAEPLQYIIGYAHFYGLSVKVTPDVLIPRPETEVLVSLTLELLDQVPSSNPCPLVLDVGTGSGVIALALKQVRPHLRIIATDISHAALTLAKRNAQDLGLDLTFKQASLLTGLTHDVCQAALITANLPYLPHRDRSAVSQDVRAEPSHALFSGEDGLMHCRILCQQAFRNLGRGGRVVLELDPRNIHQAALEASHWQCCTVHQDLTGRDRFLVLTR